MILTGLTLGAVLGAVMQRRRFCVTGMLRDIFLQRSWRTFVALLIVIAVHAVGIAALTSAGVITPEVDNFAPAAVIVGGFVFGVGIVLAGGCASGTWYRAGEGLVGSWVALVAYALSAAAMKTGALHPLNSWLRSQTVEATTLPATLGVSPWWFALGLTVVTVLLAARFLRIDASLPTPAPAPGARRWSRPLHVYTAGALVGLLGVVAWPLSAATGRNDGLGITTPSSNLVNAVITGDGARVDWGVMLVVGILVGSFLAARATGEFRVRVPDARTIQRSAVGGVLMGIGAAWAGGCTVGNGMVQTSLFSYQGWVALLFMALGVGAAARVWLRPQRAVDVPASAEQHTSAEDHVLAAPDAAPQLRIPVATGAVRLAVKPAAEPDQRDRAQATDPSGKARALGQGRYALDSVGAVCPFPLIEAKDVMAGLRPGEELVIDFDCTQATEAIPRWAATDGHEVIDFSRRGDAGWSITVRKGADSPVAVG
ncbi:YeeE/YedE thiosulfate transporter family protein [Corynebacterium uberis]|uniref:YeeE/YedE thiosulfate transporter family protein n=1 Tax=Corynebacterium uberis TaxID=2883169 RepID=UPI001D0B5137|nr:YeeE/YedE thiosulfate transporter family protein [Corynebacterium uberis]UDL77477.1 YeeE/YedE family protein [Corynebacterium uberis]